MTDNEKRLDHRANRGRAAAIKASVAWSAARFAAAEAKTAWKRAMEVWKAAERAREENR